MSESLVLRVKRLVSGSINGAVDALENSNSELVMREAIREVERASSDVRDELGSVMASRQQTIRLIERSKAKLVELGDRAKLAMEQGRDDLAEAAISRQLDIEREIPTHEARLQQLGERHSELDGYVASLDGRKAQMEADLATFVREQEAIASAAGTDRGAGAGLKAERRADRAEAAFGRAMNGPVGSMPAHSDRQTAAKLHELDRLSRSSEVADRLARLKAKVQAG